MPEGFMAGTYDTTDPDSPFGEYVTNFKYFVHPIDTT
jgi:hypothetical protein